MSNINQNLKIEKCILMSLLAIFLIVSSIGFIADTSYASDINSTDDNDELKMGVDNSIESSHDDVEILKQDISDKGVLGREYGVGGSVETIQMVINELINPGDGILVYSDCKYVEGDDTINVSKTVILKSADAYYHHRTIFDGLNSISLFSVSENAPGTVFSDLEFINMNGHSGSVITVGAKNVLIDNCSFINNHCEAGGIITTVEDPDACDNLTISNCKFIGNTAYYPNYSGSSFAAVLGIHSRNCRIINCTFESNRVIGDDGSYAGAVYIGGDIMQSGSEISGCVFKNNSVESINGLSRGGALCIDYDLNITNSTFINNKASLGGAVILQSVGKFDNCIFKGNNDNISYGGAIYQDNGNMLFNIFNSTFKGNGAFEGGAVYITGDNVNISESKFCNNTAFKGGALFIKGCGAQIIKNSFVNNTANYGGAIFTESLNTKIINSSFISNKAINEGLGGAVYSNATSTLFETNLFKLNKAINGSAIYFDTSSKQQSLIKNTFVENQAIMSEFSFTVRNIFYNETQKIYFSIVGGNIIYGEVNGLTVSNAIYADNIDEVDFEGIHPVYGFIDYEGIYRDNFLFNASFQATLSNENGVVSNKTYYSNKTGEVSFNYTFLDPGNYTLTIQHIEDGYYAGMTVTHPFTVYPQVDPQITLSTNQTSYNLYKLMQITVNITNNGPNNATNITAHNLLPDGIVYQSSNCEELINASENTLIISKLACGESVVVDIIAFVNKTGDVANDIELTVNEFDINVTNNYYVDDFIINASSDLAIRKTVTSKTPDYRTFVDWTIHVKNNGPDAAHNVILDDELPKGLVISNIVGNYDVDSGVWHIDLIESGDEVVLKMTTLVNITGNVLNNVSVKSDEYDFNLSNNYAEDYIALDPVSDLEVNITLNATTFNYLDLINITLTVVNNGPDFSHGVNLTHIIPNSLTFINSSIESYKGVFWLGDLSAGQNTSVNVICKIKTTGNFTYYASVVGDEIDFNLTNNQCLKPIIINQTSDLDVKLIVNDSNPNYNSLVDWTVIVTNNGLDTAHDIVVDLKLPDSLIYFSSTSFYDDSTGKWFLESLNPRANATLTLTSVVNGTGNILNTVNVSAREFDYNVNNNYDSKIIKVNLSSDLAIINNVNVSDVNFNDFVKWTITITNNGPDNASAVRIKDILPEGLIYVTSTLEYWHNTLFIGNLNVGQSISIDVISRINKTGNFINIANVTSANYDYDLANNFDSKAIHVNNSADLDITASFNSQNPQYNDIVNLTIIVKNKGCDVAHNITVKENLPEAMKIINSFDTQDGVWIIPSLNPSEEISLNLTCKIIKTGEMINSVNVTLNEYDCDLNNNNHTLIMNIANSCDLSVEITSNVTSANYNDYVKLTLTIKNNGPDNASDVKIENILPQSYVEVNTTYNYENNLLINVGNLAVGEIKTIDIICRVDESEEYVNTAKIISKEYDYDSTNNLDVKSILINSSADLGVISFISNSNPRYLDLINITVLVKNNGKNNAHNVSVYNMLPDGLDYISDDSNETFNPSAGFWKVGTLNSNSEERLNIQCRVNKTGNIINHVNVTSYEYDYDLSNNNDTKTIHVNSTVDLLITSCFNVSNANYGDVVKLIINVKNNGLNEASNIKITHTLPDALSYINSTHPYANGVISLGDLDKSGEVIVWMNLKVVSTGDFTSSASVSCKEHDFNLDNNNATSSISINPACDLEINVVANTTTPDLGDLINWTITVKNNGINTAHNLTITSSIPLILINSNVADKIESLNAGEEIVCNIITMANKTNLIESKFSALADEWDYNLENNKATLEINTNPACDLRITPMSNASNVNYGDLIKLSLNVSNNAFNTSNNIKVNVKVPESLVYQSSTLPIINGIVNIGNLEVGENTFVEIVYKVNGTDDINCSFNVISSVFDCNLDNNNVSVLVNVKPASDLSVAIECNSSDINYGDEINWTLKVKNNGLNSAYGVVVNYLLPSGLIFKGSDGDYDLQSGEWTIGTLDVGGEAILSIRSGVNKTGEIISFVNVYSSLFDYDLSNNNDSVVVKVNPACDLSIVALVNTSDVNYGDLIKLLLNISNVGFDSANNIKININVSDSLIYYSSTLPLNEGVVNVGSLSSGENTLVNIIYKVNSTVNQCCLFNVSSQVFDYNLSNNNASALINVKPAVDLDVAIECNSSDINYGDEINWTLKVKNNGLNSAYGVVVNYLLPDGLIFKGSDGDYDLQSGEWVIGSLDVGDEATLSIKSKINKTGSMISVVNVVCDVYDYDLSNNNDSLVIMVNPACDLLIKMSLNESEFNYNDLVEVMLNISNIGFNGANNVKVNIEVPNSLIYQSSTLPINDGIINIGNMDANENTLIKIVYKVNSTVNQCCLFNVSSQVFDYNLSNNNASDLINVKPASDLSVIIVCNNSNPNYGDKINLSLIIKNNGFDKAENITINYTISNSLILFEYDDLNIGELDVDEEVTLNFYLIVNKTGMAANSFDVSCDISDYDLNNNHAENSIYVNQASDLSISAYFNNTNLKYGDLVKVTLNITNNGLDDASDVKILNLVPDSLIYQYSTLPCRDGIIDIVKLNSGSSTDVEIVYRVNKTGNYQFYTNISASNYDFNLKNNNDTISFNIGSAADLKVTLTVNESNLNYGDYVNWTISVKNNGLDTASNVEVNTLYSKSLIYENCDLTNQFNPESGVWTVGSLDAGSEVKLNIQFKVNGTGSILNNVNVYCDVFDFYLDNNNDSKVIFVNETADLSLTVDFNNTSLNYLNNVKLVFTIKNNGLDDANNVKVFEILPESLICLSSTIPYNNNVFNIGYLPFGEEISFEVVCQVKSTGSYQNLAEVQCDEFDYDLSNNNCTSKITVNQSSDLEISLSVNNTNPNFSDLVNLSISVKNNGVDSAENVVVAYNLPESLEVVDSVYQSGEFTIRNLDVDEISNVNIICRVIKTGMGLVSVNVDCQNFDYDLKNNKDSKSIKINKSSDLEIKASFNTTNLNYGDSVKVTITVTNNGPDDASDVIIKNSHDYVNIGQIKSGEEIIFEKTFKINVTGNYSYSINVSCENFDFNISNNNFSQILLINQSSDLSVTLNVNDTSLNYHDFVNFTIIASNNGLNDAFDVKVYFLKDDSLICVGSNYNDCFDTSSSTWSFDKLCVGEKLVLNIQCMINKTGTLINEVNIKASEFDYNCTNNHAMKTVDVGFASDLSVDVKCNDTNPKYMDYVKMTFTLSNAGPNNAYDVKISEILPQGFELINSTFDYEKSFELSANQNITFDIICRVVENGGNVNFVNITSSQYDYNLENNFDVKSFMSDKASDLAINVKVNNTNPNYFDLIKLTIYITNNGPDDVDSIYISNIIPEEFILINSIGNIDYINVHETLSMEFIYKVNSTGNFTIHASVSSPYYDYNPSNNNADIPISVNRACDLEIIRIVNQVNLNYGDLLNWTIIVKNNGPDTAHNISISDLIPELVTPVIFTSSRELGDIWDIYTLNAGDEVRFNITALMDMTGVISNTVSAYASEFDYNLKNNQNESLILVNASSDLVITLDINNTNPNYKDSIKMTLTISNTGPDKASDIKIKISVPAGFDLIASSHDLDELGNLDVNQKLIIDLTYKVNTVGNYQFSVNVTCEEYDSYLANNVANKSVNINQSADLEVIKTVSNINPKIGDYINWTVTVKNNGPNTAHNVSVKDLLSKSLLYIHNTQNSNYNPQNGVWNIESIDSNSQITLIITTQIIKTGLILNNVNVTALEFDCDLNNNHANITVNVGSSIDLNISLQVNNSNPKYGDLVEWTITLTNIGKINATDVKVQEALPEGLILVNYDSSKGEYENGLWSIDKLLNHTETLKITAIVNRTGEITNEVIASANEFDVNTSNNKAAQSINVSKEINIKLNLKLNNSNPYMGDKVLISVEISNDGLDNASDVEIESNLPHELNIISHDLTKGSYSGGVWKIDSLNVGEVEKLNIICTFNQSGEFNVGFSTNETALSKNINASPIVDIFIWQYFNNTNPNYGDLIKWTIMVSNNAFERATDIQIQKIVPEGLKVINTTITKGTYSDDVWFECCLENKEVETLECICQVVKTGSILVNVNITTVKHDINLTNNHATAQLNVSKAVDLQVKSSINSTNPHFNEIVTLTINVTNYGVDEASDVNVYEFLPESLEILSEGLLKSSENYWNIPSLGVGESQTFDLKCRIVGVGEITNIAVANSTDYDFDKSNNIDRLEINSLPLADISSEMHLSNNHPNYGDLINLTFKLSNNGPNDVSNITVLDLVSDALKVITSSDDLNGANWHIKELKNGEVKQINLTCKVISTSFSNDYPKISGAFYDSNKSNNHISDNVSVNPASDLVISVETTKNHYDVGDIVEYTITVLNNGPDTANNVKVTEIADKSLILKSASSTKGQFSKSTRIWEINKLNSGESAKLVIIAIASESGTFKINASVTSDNFDNDLTNNVDLTSVSVVNKSHNREMTSNSSDNINNSQMPQNKLSVLQKHKTANPIVMLALSLMCIFVYMDDRFFKK